MAKDPAFLLYTSDFLTGTMLMTDEQVGKYIRLMCYEHQHGRLSEQDMLKICKTHDEDVFSKFHVDESGMYFNERLEFEANRRRAYSESRRKNRNSSKTCEEHMKNICETYEEHMETETETITNKTKDNRELKVTGKGVKGENPDKPKKKVFTPPTLEEITAYCKERGNDVDPKKFYDYFTAAEWVDGRGNPVKNWKQKIITWESHGGTPQRAQSPSHIQTAAEYAASKPIYKSDFAALQKKMGKKEK